MLAGGFLRRRQPEPKDPGDSMNYNVADFQDCMEMSHSIVTQIANMWRRWDNDERPLFVCNDHEQKEERP
jgi:hypothetical protein